MDGQSEVVHTTPCRISGVACRRGIYLVFALGLFMSMERYLTALTAFVFIPCHILHIIWRNINILIL